MTTYSPDAGTGLPDPIAQPEFYQDVPTKRLLAWVVDSILIGLIVALLTLLSIFTAIFFLPVVWMTVSFLYRWATLAGGSATLGMRLVSLEIRRADGSELDSVTAFLHTAGYAVSVVTFPLQLISIALMLMSERRQGLTDMVMGTAALNMRMA